MRLQFVDQSQGHLYIVIVGLRKFSIYRTQSREILI